MEETPPKSWDESQLRKYDLNLDSIPRLHWQDPKVNELMKANKPVVIVDSNLVGPALNRWTLEYLEKNLGAGNNQTVFLSPSHKFKYFTDKKIYDPVTNPKGVKFSPPTRKVEMNIGEFFRRMREWKKGDDRLYLQQPLTTSVGPEIADDFRKFNWNYIKDKQWRHKWGSLTLNILFLSMEGNVAPCHYDEQENLFAQVVGHKRCILFSPDQFECLYPYPVHHPHDRQSMVDFDRPDYSRFPNFKSAKGCEAILAPGDVLYIPIYWWHHVESLVGGGPTVAINFWYKGASTSMDYPLLDHQKVSIMRNVEKMLLEVLQDPKEVGPLLRTMVQGRFVDPSTHSKE